MLAYLLLGIAGLFLGGFLIIAARPVVEKITFERDEYAIVRFEGDPGVRSEGVIVYDTGEKRVEGYAPLSYKLRLDGDSHGVVVAARKTGGDGQLKVTVEVHDSVQTSSVNSLGQVYVAVYSTHHD